MGERVLWAFRHDLPGESDEQLADRAREGDASAFGELYRRHRKAAESTAWCLLRSKSDADDVVSEAFAGVLSALRNGRGPRDNFRGYLLACVRNACRSRRSPTVLVDENQLERWNPSTADPEKYVEADTVARAFSSLAPRWQHTLWMTEVEQLPPSEVSERLDLSPNAAAALTHRAREAFAEAYLAEHMVAATGKECRKLAPLLPGYVRDQLRVLQQASVERHIMNCQICARAVDDLRDVNASLRSLLPLAPAVLGTATAATEVVVAGTVATVGGGLSIGLPSAGLLLKGLLAAALVAPVLSGDTPFSGRGDDGPRALSVADNDVQESASGAAPDAGTRPATTTAAAPATTVPDTSATTVPADGAASAGEEHPAATPMPTGPAASVATPPVSLPVAIPIPIQIPATNPNGLLPNVPVAGPLVDGLLEDTVEPVVGVVTEPVIETLDEALAVLGLGTTGETVTMLRSLVPLLDGPLLGSVVDELLDVTSIVPDPTESSGSGSETPDVLAPVDDLVDDVIGVVGGDPSGSVVPPSGAPAPGAPGAEPPAPGAPPATAPSGSAPAIPLPAIPLPAIPLPAIPLPEIPVPAISLPPISVPAISLPAISVPAISVPILDLPAVVLPVLSVPVIELPPIVIPPITLPDLLG